MTDQNDKIKKLFNSKFNDFEPEYSASSWDQLESILSSNTTISNLNQDNSPLSKKISIRRIVAISTSIAAVLLVGVLTIYKLTESEYRYFEAIEKAAPKVIVEIDQDSEELITNISPQQFAKRSKSFASTRDNIIDYKEIDNNTYTDTIKDQDETFSTIEHTEQKNDRNIDYNQNLVSKRANNKEASENEKLLVPKKRSKQRGFSIGVNANTGLANNDVNQKGGGLLFSQDVRSQEFNAILKRENSNFKIDHKQPISFGLMVGKDLTDEVSLETGIVFTHLSSKLSTESSFGLDESRSFNYIGVPVSVNYTFAELGNAKFYATVGGMIQKDINGKYESKMNPSSNIVSSANNDVMQVKAYSEPYYVKESLKQKNMQLSIHTSVGVKYPIYKKLNVYGNVGGAYYFDANNHYRTIYSDKKTQLDFRVGLKIDL